MQTLKIFISYAKNDYNLMTAIEHCCKEIKQIKFNNQIYTIDVWCDHHLLPGESWKSEITNRIKDADVILFLLSTNFLKSDFIINTEIPLAIKRKQESEIGVLGIYMEDCEFGSLKIKKTQLIPSYRGRLKAISTWKQNNECWDAVKDGIEICCYNSIANMPWNKQYKSKLPSRLTEKNFTHNAPPELQYLNNQWLSIEARKQAIKDAQRRDEEKENLMIILIFCLLAILLILIYIKYFI